MMPIDPADPILRLSSLWGNWVPDSFLGEGGYGRVYHAHRVDEPRYASAVKHICIPKNEYERAEGAHMHANEEGLEAYFNGEMPNSSCVLIPSDIVWLSIEALLSDVFLTI